MACTDPPRVTKDTKDMAGTKFQPVLIALIASGIVVVLIACLIILACFKRRRAKVRKKKNEHTVRNRNQQVQHQQRQQQEQQQLALHRVYGSREDNFFSTTHFF